MLVVLVQPDRDILNFMELLSMRPVRSLDIALRRYVEMSAGQTGVPVLSIVIHPLQPRGRGRGDRPLADQASDVL